jgi:hypothetical protein
MVHGFWFMVADGKRKTGDQIVEARTTMASHEGRNGPTSAGGFVTWLGWSQIKKTLLASWKTQKEWHNPLRLACL